MKSSHELDLRAYINLILLRNLTLSASMNFLHKSIYEVEHSNPYFELWQEDRKVMFNAKPLTLLAAKEEQMIECVIIKLLF